MSQYLSTLGYFQSSHGDPISDMFAEEFSDEMSKQFQEAMRSVMEDDPEMLAEINRLAEAAGNAGRWQHRPGC